MISDDSKEKRALYDVMAFGVFAASQGWTIAVLLLMGVCIYINHTVDWDR